MQTKPYPFINKKYNRSCCLCGRVCNGVNRHVTYQREWEAWLVGARKEAGIPVRPEEIIHLTNT